MHIRAYSKARITFYSQDINRSGIRIGNDMVINVNLMDTKNVGWRNYLIGTTIDDFKLSYNNHESAPIKVENLVKGHATRYVCGFQGTRYPIYLATQDYSVKNIKLDFSTIEEAITWTNKLVNFNIGIDQITKDIFITHATINNRTAYYVNMNKNVQVIIFLLAEAARFAIVRTAVKNIIECFATYQWGPLKTLFQTYGKMNEAFCGREPGTPISEIDTLRYILTAQTRMGTSDDVQSLKNTIIQIYQTGQFNDITGLSEQIEIITDVDLKNKITTEFLNPINNGI